MRERAVRARHVGEVEAWLALSGTPLEYEEGFNLNGIASSPDGAYLIVVQSNTGELFRITTETKEVTQIDLRRRHASRG